ncbi:MAG: hypothetical protein ACYDHU_06055 [Acidimicrobiales bacterium]
MTCHVVQFLLEELMELEARRATASRGIDDVAQDPEERPSSAPSAARSIAAFSGFAGHQLFGAEGNLVQSGTPLLAPLREEPLDLLGVPAGDYT